MYKISIDCRERDARYATRKDAQFAVGVALQRADVGTVASIELDREYPNRVQTDRYNVKRSKARGVHIVWTDLAA